MAQWSKNLESLPHITQAIVDKWANETANIPRSKQQKGYSNFIEGYIHDIEVQTTSSCCRVRAKAYPSMRKNNPPYNLMVTLTREAPFIKASMCECKAGNGHCSHSIGLLYVLCHFCKLDLKAVPPVQSKTSLPQTWHIPQRTEGLAPKEVQWLAISKVKPEKTKKRKRVTEGVLPKTYCPVPQPIPSNIFTTTLVQQLKAIKSDAQTLKFLSPSTSVYSDSRFGPVPKGSVLSYQQPVLSVNQCSIIYPDLSFADQPTDYAFVLSNSEMDVFKGLQVTPQIALDIESQTRLQSHNKTWYDVRKHRLTSSIFKNVCSRIADHQTLAKRLINKKNIQTAAMKYGIEHEPEASDLYCEITGNAVNLCGFVINPSSPHLGTSPDRKVYDKTAPTQFGLLEIKCPSTEHFADCKYLQKYKTGNYKLKTNHQYFYQVMGQMALTDMKWCDFFVKCSDAYHLERIHFDIELWKPMKSSLDKFYFEYYLPEICNTKH